MDRGRSERRAVKARFVVNQAHAGHAAKRVPVAGGRRGRVCGSAVGWRARFGVTGLTLLPPSMLGFLSNLGWEAPRGERPRRGRLADHTREDKNTNPDPVGGPVCCVSRPQTPGVMGRLVALAKSDTCVSRTAFYPCCRAGYTGADTRYWMRPRTTVFLVSGSI